MGARLRRLRSEESGFTLPELLTGMTVGMIVLMAAFLLLDTAVSRSGDIEDRQDATQRGRMAMEAVTRDLRSQVCLATSRPIISGSDTHVEFFANLSDDTEAADRRTLRYDATRKQIDLDVYAGTGIFPDLIFPSTPTSTEVVLEDVIPAKDGSVDRPLFRYYAYVVNGQPGEVEELATPLSAANRQRVVLVKVAFAALPTRTAELSGAELDAATFESDVYVRLADPTKPVEGPRCL